ncbi:hypothetical protein FA15DRAFT_177171 [Coprinopsis marcescibilis]|uniref:AIG1-type G domain-containing protein n=1 Tax=Coprinopsis marcescibilis TaxID=230819 RepID=A0A5C3KGP8_COPMA|nr:hypothetical protein FA15DRAFT_177171 [Coprinopsis marcescibilis]
MAERNLPVLILVLGATGSGKSAYINAVTGEDTAEVNDKMESVTLNISHYSYTLPGWEDIQIIDTLGSDSYAGGVLVKSDLEIFREIQEYLKKNFGADKQMITGVIYLHNVTSPKVSAMQRRTVRLFEKMCGPEFMKNIAVVTTFWDHLSDPQVGVDKEAQLMAEEGLFKELCDGGAQFFRWGHFEAGTIPSDPRFQTPREVVAHLLQLNPKPLQAQEEMADGAPFEATSGGIAFLESLIQDLREDFKTHVHGIDSRFKVTEEGQKGLSNQLATHVGIIDGEIKQLQEVSESLVANQGSLHILDADLKLSLDYARKDKENLESECKELRQRERALSEDLYRAREESLSQKRELDLNTTHLLDELRKLIKQNADKEQEIRQLQDGEKRLKNDNQDLLLALKYANDQLDSCRQRIQQLESENKRQAAQIDNWVLVSPVEKTNQDSRMGLGIAQHARTRFLSRLHIDRPGSAPPMSPHVEAYEVTDGHEGEPHRPRGQSRSNVTQQPPHGLLSKQLPHVPRALPKVRSMIFHRPSRPSSSSPMVPNVPPKDTEIRAPIPTRMTARPVIRIGASSPNT